MKRGRIYDKRYDNRVSGKINFRICIPYVFGDAFSTILQHGGYDAGRAVSRCQSACRRWFHRFFELYGNRILYRSLQRLCHSSCPDVWCEAGIRAAEVCNQFRLAVHCIFYCADHSSCHSLPADFDLDEYAGGNF